MRETLDSRFWRQVRLAAGDGCYLWDGCTNPHRGGYGVIWDGRRQAYAHRVAWTLAHGPVPQNMCVLHRCDQPLCVRADHLFLGDQATNMRDMARKGRGRTKCQRGVQNNRAILAEDDVRAIRNAASNGATTRRLAAVYGVSQSNIVAVVKRRTWHWVE